MALAAKMLDALIWLAGDVLCYGTGYWVLRLLSLGRCRPERDRYGLVSLLGLLVHVAWAVPLLIWMGRS